MYSVLIVEDEKPISELIRINLEAAGYRCETAADGLRAADMLEEKRYDLVLLDVMLPGADGFELMTYIRPLDIPVIFLTAKADVKDRVKGLSLGADDYIVKPFAVVELLARVKAVIRRAYRQEETLSIAGVTIKPDSHSVARGGEEIALTPKEFDLLLLFAQNPNIALYRDVIFERVWQGDFLGETRTVDLHVQRLRKKLDWEDCLKTIHRIGYRLEVKL